MFVFKYAYIYTYGETSNYIVTFVISNLILWIQTYGSSSCEIFFSKIKHDKQYVTY